jgi:DNA-binding PadR family transcriptional regulator
MWRQHWDWREGRRERVFEKGDFKYVILDLLQEQPSHGYQLIRRIEERFGGRYAPSPGVLYPTLQMLEDMGCVTATQDEGRKVYAITDEGRRLLADRGERVEGIRERAHRWRGGRHGEDFYQALRDLASFLGGYGNTWDVDGEKARRIGDVIARARREIEAILAERPSSEAAAAAGPRPADNPPHPGRRPDMI